MPSSWLHSAAGTWEAALCWRPRFWHLPSDGGLQCGAALAPPRGSALCSPGLVAAADACATAPVPVCAVVWRM